MCAISGILWVYAQNDEASGDSKWICCRGQVVGEPFTNVEIELADWDTARPLNSMNPERKLENLKLGEFS